MLISINGPSLESFNPQAAVNHWASIVHRRPGVRKPKTSIDVDDDEESEDAYDFSDYSDDDIAIDLKDDFDNEELIYRCIWFILGFNPPPEEPTSIRDLRKFVQDCLNTKYGMYTWYILLTKGRSLNMSYFNKQTTKLCKAV